MSADLAGLVIFLLGALFGLGVAGLILLWNGVRQVQAERQALAQRRERMRP